MIKDTPTFNELKAIAAREGYSLWRNGDRVYYKPNTGYASSPPRSVSDALDKSSVAIIMKMMKQKK